MVRLPDEISKCSVAALLFRYKIFCVLCGCDIQYWSEAFGTSCLLSSESTANMLASLIPYESAFTVRSYGLKGKLRG